MKLDKTALKAASLQTSSMLNAERIIRAYLDALHFPIIRNLSPTQVDVYNTLIDNYPLPISAERIASIVYANDSTGGPLNSRNVIHVMLNQMRKKLSGSGITISKIGSGYSGGYTIIFEDKKT